MTQSKQGRTMSGIKNSFLQQWRFTFLAETIISLWLWMLGGGVGAAEMEGQGGRHEGGCCWHSSIKKEGLPVVCEWSFSFGPHRYSSEFEIRFSSRDNNALFEGLIQIGACARCPLLSLSEPSCPYGTQRVQQKITMAPSDRRGQKAQGCVSLTLNSTEELSDCAVSLHPSPLPAHVHAPDTLPVPGGEDGGVERGCSARSHYS